jgi:uncharacterized protein (DUF2267 family)
MTTGIDVLERSEQETNIWLNALEKRLDTDRRKAFNALRATLHAVRDRVGPDNALHLAAQLPLIIKGLFFEDWRPSETPTREREKDTFLANVQASVFRGLRVDPERAVRAVLEVISEHIDASEVAKLRNLFPENMRDLFPEAAPRPGAAARRRGDRGVQTRRRSARAEQRLD